MGLLGDFVSLFAGNGDEDASKRLLDQVNAEAGSSAFSSIQTDPRLRTDQMSSLDALRSIASSGGMRTQDKVAYDQALQRGNQNEQANRGAIFQNMASRGMGGSAYELSQQLANEQGQATRNAMTGAQMASDADKRALSALSQSGQMAGDIRGQDWGEAAGKAQGEDAMSRFNAGERLRKAGMQSGVYADSAEANRKRWGKVGDDVGSIAGSFIGGGF